MPELFDVARHYDDTKVYDAYLGDFLFNGQFSTFSESSPEGSTSRKRILSLDPALTIPTRRAISLLGEAWLVAQGLVDGFNNVAIRRTFWLKLITDTCAMLSPAAACLGSAGVDVKVFREEYKYTVNTGTDSQYDPFWSLSVAPVEGATRGTFFRIGSTLLRARMVALAKEGLHQVLCDQLDDGARTTAVFLTGTYNPITDSVSVGTTSASAIIFDAYQYYNYATAADDRLHSGDKTMFVPVASVTPKVGMVIQALGRDWTVLTQQIEVDCWALHLRLK